MFGRVSFPKRPPKSSRTAKSSTVSSARMAWTRTTSPDNKSEFYIKSSQLQTSTLSNDTTPVIGIG